MIKEYPKEYEDVFAEEKYANKQLDINLLTTDIGLNGLEYAQEIRKLLLDYQKSTFDYIVKFTWLVRKFKYDGHLRNKRWKNGFNLERAYFIFFLKYVGLSNRIFGNSGVNNKIINYIDELFEDFDDRDPFKEKIEYPYKYVFFEYLFLVYQMEERMELLKIAEDRKMSYRDFLNYVTNYISCLNEELDKPKYWIKNSSYIPPYIHIEKEQKSKKRKRLKHGRTKKQTAQTSCIC